MPKILLIDDDVELSSMLQEYLESDGFEVSVTNDSFAGAQLALKEPFDLVVLDVMMPELDGIQVLKLVRKSMTLPVIMLTAKGDEGDRFSGLELGADDYIPKPCTPRELCARIRAILRRANANVIVDKAENIEIGALTIQPEKRQALWNQTLINFTNVEYSLLEVLAKNVGQPVSKEVLCQQGLGRKLTKFDRSVDVHISSIRQKLCDLNQGERMIQTVFRVGYQLVK